MSGCNCDCFVGENSLLITFLERVYLTPNLHPSLRLWLLNAISTLKQSRTWLLSNIGYETYESYLNAITSATAESDNQANIGTTVLVGVLLLFGILLLNRLLQIFQMFWQIQTIRTLKSKLFRNFRSKIVQSFKIVKVKNYG